MNNILAPFSRLDEKKKLLIVMALVGVLAVGISSKILNSYFTGDDEANFLNLSNYILGRIIHGDFSNIWLSLYYHDHPPIPILMAVPFVYLVGYSEAALRLPNVLLWSFSCMIAAKVAWRLGGLRVALFTGILLAGSGLFDLEAMGDGKTLEVLSVLLMTNVVLDNFEWSLETRTGRKQYIWGGIYLAVGFLFFTSTLPVIGMYHLIFAIIFLSRKFTWANLKLYILYSMPLILYYIIFNVVFLGLPAYDYFVNGSAAYGQFAQNLGRAGTSHLNFDSFLVNLRVMNWFFLPFVSWIILTFGIFYQAKKFWYLFLITIPYAAIWSFYLSINTGHHFLAYFCWLAPFGITYIFQLGEKLGKKTITFAMVSLFLLVFSWSYIIHIRTYTFDNYPRYLLPVFYGETTGWINNIYRPVRKIARDLDGLLGPNSTIISLIDGSFRTFYYPEDKRYPPISLSNLDDPQSGFGKCYSLNTELIKQYKLRAVVSYKDQIVCPNIVEKVIEYPGSNLQLTILSR